MSFTRALQQTTTYWAPADASSDLYGKPTYSAPVQLPCRWENRVELVRSKSGQEIASQARVFLAQTVSLDGYLLLGTSSAVDPTLVTGAFEIQAISSIPDLRNLKTLTAAYL